MKTLFSSICVLVLLSSSLLAQDPPTPLDRTLFHCENLIADGKLVDALRILTRVRETEKKDHRVVFLMAQCEYNLWRKNGKDEHMDRARKLLVETYRLKKPYPEAAFVAGLIETDLKNYGEAAKAFRAALAGKFRPTVSRKNLALALFHYGLDLAERSKEKVHLADEAILVFEEARDRCEQIKDDTRNLPADRRRFRKLWLKSYSNLAAMHQQAQNYPPAEKILKQLIEIQPRKPYHYHNLGLLYGRKREWKEAERCYLKALEVDGHYVEPHLKLAYIRSSVDKNYEEAEKHFAVFLKRHPDSWEGHYELGAHYVRRQDYEKAIAEYRRCIEIDEEAFSAMGKLAEVLRRSGKVEEAEKWQEKFQKLEKEATKGTAPPQPEED